MPYPTALPCKAHSSKLMERLCNKGGGFEEKKDEFLVSYGYRHQAYKELIHANCCPETARSQAKNEGAPQEVPLM